MLFKQINLHSPLGWSVCGFGLLCTVLGWFRAEHLVQERAGFRLASQSTGKRSQNSRCADGYGGLWFLVQSTFNRSVLVGLGMAGIFVFIFAVMLAPKFSAISQQTNGAAQFNPMKENFFFIFSFQSMWIVALQMIPISLNLRFLRTLPVSSTKLAAVLAFTPLAAMLVVLYLMGVFAAIGCHQPLSSAVEVFRQGGILQITLAAIIVPVLVWRGWGMVTYFVFIAMMIAGIFGSFQTKVPLSLITSSMISLMLISGSFVTTKLLLERSSHVYRPRPSGQFGGWGWGAGR